MDQAALSLPPDRTGPEGGAMWFLRAVAFDLDGTLTEDDHLAEGAIDAIRAASGDPRMILVAGRPASAAADRRRR